MKSKMCVFALVLLLAFTALSWAGGRGEAAVDEKPTVAFMSNGPYEFWVYAAAGVEQAAQEFGVNAEFFMPPGGLPEEQRRFIEAMVARDVAGIAISVTDPENLAPFLNEIIEMGVPIVTHDSDAPASNRLAFVGMSNYAAGRTAGRTIREALPDGGNFIVSVGRLDAQNAIERRQGIIDELNGEPDAFFYPGTMTPDRPDIALGGGKWTLIDTIVDAGDPIRAKSNAEDAILRHRERLDLMIGLWSYSTPAIISAAQDAGVMDEFIIVAFDQEEEVLQGIKDGYVYASMAQDPFMYGYKSVEILAKIAHGQDPAIPDDKFVDVPAPVITQQNIDEVWAMFRQQLAEGREFLDELGIDQP